MVEVDNKQADSNDQQEEEAAPQSAFKAYLESNPEALQPLFKAVVQLYTDPQKESATIQILREKLGIEDSDADGESIKVENRELRREIFDLQDEVKKLEDQLQELIEENM